MSQFLIRTIIIFYIVQFFLLVNGSSNVTLVKLQRGKRYLDFLKSSRLSFRANGRNNILDVNTLFAYAYGFRANYPIENDKKHNTAVKRDIYRVLETFMDSNGFDGKACILKSFCTSLRGVTNGSGILFKAFKLILSFTNMFYKGTLNEVKQIKKYLLH